MMDNAGRDVKESDLFQKIRIFRKEDRYAPIMTVSIQLGVGVTCVTFVQNLFTGSSMTNGREDAFEITRMLLIHISTPS